MAAATATGGSGSGDAGKSSSRASDGCPENPCVKVPHSVLAVAVVWMAVLVACFFLYERDAAFAQFVEFKLGRLPFEAIWFGAVGGFLVSAQGIFMHNREWRRSYDYWHYVRPLLGALVGTLGCLIFLVLNEAATKQSATANPVFYDVIALAIGYRERSFRTLIEKLSDTIILPGKDESKDGGSDGKAGTDGADGDPGPGPDAPRGGPGPKPGEPTEGSGPKREPSAWQPVAAQALTCAIAIWAILRRESSGVQGRMRSRPKPAARSWRL
jgi:hypothetical protein